VEGIDGGRSVTPSLREGVYAQLLMDLTHQSHEANRWVEVPDFENVLNTSMYLNASI
jgi:hypothetical protein